MAIIKTRLVGSNRHVVNDDNMRQIYDVLVDMTGYAEYIDHLAGLVQCPTVGRT